MINMLGIFISFFSGVLMGFVDRLWPKVFIILLLSIIVLWLISSFLLPVSAIDFNNYYLRWGVLLEIGGMILGLFAGRAMAKVYEGN